MCINIRLDCQCGGSSANIMNKNNILPLEVVQAVFCPACSGEVDLDPESMVMDNGWVIAYDMEIASFHLNRCGIALPRVNPLVIFDEGYSSWNGFTPTELQDSYESKRQLRQMFENDVEAYMEAMKDWGRNRAEKLKQEGWRKARHG